MIYFPGTINIVSTRLYCHDYIHYQYITPHLPAVHINLLCACWHSEAVKGSSSLSSRRLLISLWVTSSLFLCPEPTDAPCPYLRIRPPLPQDGAPIHRVRTHSLSGSKTVSFLDADAQLFLFVDTILCQTVKRNYKHSTVSEGQISWWISGFL